MTNIERLNEIKKITPVLDHIKEYAKKILECTYDLNIYVDNIKEVKVSEDGVELIYECRCCGECYTKYRTIPVKWFDEEFNYIESYKELLHSIEEERAKKEYETFLRLKKKYEAKGENK